VFGGIESGRKYSLLLEVRRPPDGPVAIVEAGWTTGERIEVHRAEVAAPWSADPGAAVADVRRAVDILQVLRAANDKDAQLASYRARRELAVLENRDPELIATLDKLIAEMLAPAGAAAPKSGGSQPLAARLSEHEQLLLDADWKTIIPPEEAITRLLAQRKQNLVDGLNGMRQSGRPAGEILAWAAQMLLRTVATGYERDEAVALFDECIGRLVLARQDEAYYRWRFLRALYRGDPSAF
jgi:hypothetical protein